jgi:hypothetical protein
VPTWYENKEYDKIIEYIKNEAKAFIQLNTWLYKEIPKCMQKYREEKGI